MTSPWDLNLKCIFVDNNSDSEKLHRTNENIK